MLGSHHICCLRFGPANGQLFLCTLATFCGSKGVFVETPAMNQPMEKKQIVKLDHLKISFGAFEPTYF